MKKQLQKIFFLLFLTGCMAAPQHCFEDNFKSDKNYHVPFQKIVFTSNCKKFDSAHHIENRLPQTPEMIMRNWIRENLTTDPHQEDTLEIILQKAEIIRENLPSEHWWQPDYVKDTLDYNIELVQHNDPIQRLTVAGKAYVQMGRRISLMDKEKQWAELYRTMLDHLGKEIIKLPHETEPHKS